MAERSRSADPGGEAVRRALLAVLEGDPETAERELAGVVREDARDALAFLALAHLYRARGEIGRAIRIDQNLLLEPSLDPELRRRARAALAADLRAGGYRDRAIAAYEDVLAHDRKDAVALDALVDLLAEAGAYERALEVLRRSAGLLRRPDPRREARLLLARARDERKEGRIAAARKSLRRALKRDPSLLEAQALLGEIEAERGKLRAAIKAWQAALAAEPPDGEYAEALWERIRAACEEAGKPQDFESVVRAHLEAHPGDPVAARALARTLAQRGEVEAAAALLRAQLERAPGDPAAHALLARLLLEHGPEPQARKAVDELLEVLAPAPGPARRGRPPADAQRDGASSPDPGSDGAQEPAQSQLTEGAEAAP